MSETAIDVEVVELTTAVEMTELALDVAVTEPAIEVSHEEVAVEVLLAGPAGPRGADGSGAIEMPFGYGDATPRLITTVPAGKFVYEVDLIITTAFNGVGAALAVGDAGIADRLLAIAENAPGTLGTYTTHPNVAYLVGTAVNLTITPGAGASQGAGIVRLIVQQ